ncbi:MAG: type II toxin-antitoxin system RelE/ParE family toxin [Bacteroidota bacterium]|nr:type II toxin-antitoxin system RelE/ParE family toxin [Bacteroidota bacterium]
MVKRIVWSLTAQQDRKNILEYWNVRNKSKTYSKKLNELLKSSIKLISTHPNIGKKTNYSNIRFKVVRDYQIFYEETLNSIDVLRIWDSRQEPDKLKLTK